MLDCFDLTGRVVFITGGSVGLGLGFAKAFAGSGADVSIIARREDKLMEAKKTIEALGARCLCCVADVTDAASVQTAVDRTVETFGRLDFLINNTGGGAHRVPLENVTLENWNMLIDLNLTSTFVVSQICARQMIKQNFGRIVNVASIAGHCFHNLGDAYGGAYGAAKEGVKGLTRAMVMQWQRYNININSISPGYFLTEANENFCRRNPDTGDRLAQMSMLKRWGNPDEMGPVGVFLCSGAASYMQGANVIVDGGRTFI